MADPILEIDRLGVSFFTRGGEIPAVMDFSCRIMPGQAMGLVGESGCGKSTVALASGPGIFRIVRSLTLDIKTREYVFAAQTRGESPWYVMLWEILPNARGPLIVDTCLRIGYTTILLGALGYFGLGMAPESPDWGTMIKESSRFMRIYVHPALPPALAMMSFVLGLNLLADAIREQSLRD